MSGFLGGRNNLFGGRDGSPQPPRDPYTQRGPGSYDQPMNGYDPRGQAPGPPHAPGLPSRVQPTRPMHQSAGSRGGGRGGARWQLVPAKSPDNSFTFRNLVAVSSAEFPPSRDGTDLLLLVNGKFVVSARPTDFPPGQIGMSEPQRSWMGVALTDTLSVDIYDAFSQGNQAYLGSLDIEVGFASKNKTPQTPYDQDELAKEVVKVRIDLPLQSLKLTLFPRYSRTRCLPLASDF
jgi:vesicle-fusing ATPase